MDYNYLIQEYLDGTLDAAQEQDLFAALSTDSALRNELKQAIALDKGLNKRVTAFVPSSAATLGLFTKLGIGAAVSTGVAAVGFKGMITSFFAAHSATVISTIIAVALTAGSFLAFYNPPDISNQPNNNLSYNGMIKNTQPAGPQLPNIVAKSTDKEKNNLPVRIDTVVQYITKTRYITTNTSDNNIKEKDAKDNFSSTEQEPLQLLTSAFSPSESDNSVNLSTSNSAPVLLPTERNYSPMEIDINSDKTLNLSFEIKGNGYWSIPEPEVPQYNTPIFTNLQLSTLYNFNDKFKLGLDLRSESFYQMFTGTNEIGEEFEYKQYPNYYTLSVIGRYSFIKKQNYDLFAQGSLGGTVTGMVSRLMFGIELSPYSNISFLLGIEGSTLTYLHQNSIFNSPKIGLNYGVAFNF